MGLKVASGTFLVTLVWTLKSDQDGIESGLSKRAIRTQKKVEIRGIERMEH